ncbi:MAG: sugar phosphorylase [Spirochaetota bacterium]
MNTIASHLIALYGEAAGRAAFDRLAALIAHYRTHIPAPRAMGLTERDAILITYADQVQEPGRLPLRSLADFCERYLVGTVSGIHLLPFYPSSSDDGFAVIDYRVVDPVLGDWDDVGRLNQRFRLVFDAVFNHVSAQSRWFQSFLRDDPVYSDYFIVVPEGTDLSQVVRPRSSPLLTRFATPSGEKLVWTTFSPDQVDLNYTNPAVLLKMIDTLLFYVSHGAGFIRLDAIAYLWKELGTPCIHLPQTHRIIQLLKAVLDEAAPHVGLITETNVPHTENIAYFGDGTNEAQLVYNFALPPLVLHAFHTGNARTLSQWAGRLSRPGGRVTFLNFLASHDGIGLNPARGILKLSEIEALVRRALAHGGLVSYKNNPDGTTSPYELNLNYFNALSNPVTDEAIDLRIDRFMAAQAIMLALVGVPGIYFHSLFGSEGWREGVSLSGSNRAINREKCDRTALEGELDDPGSRRHNVFIRYKQLLNVRTAHPAFHPQGEQRVLNCDRSIFALLRRAPDEAEQVLCLHNVSSKGRVVELDLRAIFDFPLDGLTDLITGQTETATARQTLRLNPYQVFWLKPGVQG